MDQPGKVANPARDQLNRENKYKCCTLELTKNVEPPVSIVVCIGTDTVVGLTL